MNLEQLRQSNRIIGEFVAGSHAYGLNIATSDVDIRGIFLNPLRERLSLSFAGAPSQIGDEKHDTTYYELARFIELAKDCNPNIIEFLWMPNDVWRIKTPIMEELIANRRLFLSKKAYYTFSSYAYSQIKKAKGQNKWINNPQPKETPSKLDFCWIIPNGNLYSWNVPVQPGKPMPLGSLLGWTAPEDFFSKCHVAGMEHVPSMYRLYYYGHGANGVFRGPHQQLVCESIPLEDEATKLIGFLVFNETEYDKAVADHKNYWEWMKNRNPHRYVAQENGEVDYDVKNMMHCLRLLWSSESILQEGCPIVRFEGSRRQFLMDVRAGKFRHEELMEMTENLMTELKLACEVSTAVPHHVDGHAINDLYLELILDNKNV